MTEQLSKLLALVAGQIGDEQAHAILALRIGLVNFYGRFLKWFVFSSKSVSVFSE